ncbi:MAG: CPBP family glutamic-type intramembrane protease [Desulfobacterales bacterium]|nr:CPBP family glutamic-type intramembrane protease [Desulfobacterales bacterium]
MDKERKTVSGLVNRDLLLPYALPYFAYVGLAVVGNRFLDKSWVYTLKIIIVPSLLVWAWKWYLPIKGPKRVSGSILYGIGFGLAGLLAWCLLMAPFIDAEAEPWDNTAFFLRLLSASLIVPVFEEIFIRGYIFRAAYQWDILRKRTGAVPAINEMLEHRTIEDVKPGAWSVMAIVVSTVAFTAGHVTMEWPACIAYSLILCWLYIIRKDLLSMIVAHGITNLGLALYVRYSGHWGFW